MTIIPNFNISGEKSASSIAVHSSSSLSISGGGAWRTAQTWKRTRCELATRTSVFITGFFLCYPRSNVHCAVYSRKVPWRVRVYFDGISTHASAQTDRCCVPQLRSHARSGFSPLPRVSSGKSTQCSRPSGHIFDARTCSSTEEWGSIVDAREALWMPCCKFTSRASSHDMYPILTKP